MASRSISTGLCWHISDICRIRYLETEYLSFFYLRYSPSVPAAAVAAREGKTWKTEAKKREPGPLRLPKAVRKAATSRINYERARERNDSQRERKIGKQN